jgi:hypothetical protein
MGPGQTLHLFYDVRAHPKWEAVSVLGDRRMLEEMARAFSFLDEIEKPNDNSSTPNNDTKP